MQNEYMELRVTLQLLVIQYFQKKKKLDISTRAIQQIQTI